MLVVDDDQAVCESASELLKDLGMRGDWVLSGGEAVVRIAMVIHSGVVNLSKIR